MNSWTSASIRHVSRRFGQRRNSNFWSSKLSKISPGQTVQPPKKVCEGWTKTIYKHVFFKARLAGHCLTLRLWPKRRTAVESWVTLAHHNSDQVAWKRGKHQHRSSKTTWQTKKHQNSIKFQETPFPKSKLRTFQKSVFLLLTSLNPSLLPSRTARSSTTTERPTVGCGRRRRKMPGSWPGGTTVARLCLGTWGWGGWGWKKGPLAYRYHCFFLELTENTFFFFFKVAKLLNYLRLWGTLINISMYYVRAGLWRRCCRNCSLRSQFASFLMRTSPHHQLDSSFLTRSHH